MAAITVAATITAGVAPAAADEPGSAGKPSWFTSPDGGPDYERSATLAYEFLDERVDTYGTGDELRLARSYQGGFFDTLPGGFVSSFIYDDALVVLAYLSRGLPQDIRRAAALGDAILFVQDNDPVGDGRTRASYQPDSLQAGVVEIGSPASFTGNQAWAGMALARLYDVTGEQRYLDGALRLGEWIQTNTSDTERAPFGYTGGQDGDGNVFTFKATEHNIDLTGFFAQLATLTGDPIWTERSALAAGFVDAMRADDGFLWTGTNPDGVTTNYYPIPEDPQAWSYLATLDERYAPALDWTLDNLYAVDGPYEGPSFSNADVSKVWFEGSGQLALALRARDAEGDAERVDDMLASVELAQRDAVNGDGRGIVAASSDGLDTGFGDLYYSSLHTGATAWYLLAVTGFNPFRLDPADSTAPSEDARADLSVSVAGLPAVLGRSQSASVSVTVRNSGPDAAAGLVTGVSLGPGISIRSATDGKVRPGRRTAIWPASDLASGVSVTYRMTISATGRSRTTWLSAGTFSAVPDPSYSDNLLVRAIEIR